MTIELKLTDGKEIIIFPRRESTINENLKNYYLVDSLNYVWLKLELINNSFEIIYQDLNIADTDEELRIKLDILVVELIEAEQSGTELSEGIEIEDVSPYDPEKIKIHSKAFNLRLISDMIDDGDIDLSPDFQRKYVWDSHQKSRLIESILLRIPLPMFYFSEDEEGRITVVDGLQRLTTIKQFMENKFPLRGLEYLKSSCEGKYYSEFSKDGTYNGKNVIESKYFRWFNQTQFSVNVIDPTSPPKVKYDIFRRINTGGKPLNNQEIRNCLSSPSLRSLLNEMVCLEEFKTATDFSIKANRMDDQEIALRFILFSQLYSTDEFLNNYNGYIDSSLDDLTEKMSKISDEEKLSWIHKFSNAMKNAEYLIGNKHAFRKITESDLVFGAHKQLLNKALFVVWSVLLSNYENSVIVEKNNELSLQKIIANYIQNDEVLFSYLSYGTNGKANLQYAFSQFKSILSENINH